MSTHYREVDYRVDWMRDLFESLNHGFSMIQEKLNTIDYFDGLFAQEQAEMIFGISFVTAQTYITGTVSDMSAININSGLSKADMLNIGSPLVANNVPKVLLINTIANYYKHHEEWGDWHIESHNRRTIQTLSQVGINGETSFPCHEAARIIWPTEVLCELNYLLNVLVEWRQNLLQHVKGT